ncbi:MAG: Uma2 family endonuclease, partial [Campylobacterales bacterium]|nr:Uma2 family endonuclease [Campylobacterales bacterium]
MNLARKDDLKYTQNYKKQKYTYNDYLAKEGRWELLNGQFWNMAPAPYPKHQKVLFYMAKEMEKHFNCPNCEIYISPIDWKIDDENVVQPDIAIFCEEPTKQYFSKTPPLIVEVLSPSTAIKDINLKYKLYEKAGVKYYIMVEPNEEFADIFMLKNDSFEFQ